MNAPLRWPVVVVIVTMEFGRTTMLKRGPVWALRRPAGFLNQVESFVPKLSQTERRPVESGPARVKFSSWLFVASLVSIMMD